MVVLTNTALVQAVIAVVNVTVDNHNVVALAALQPHRSQTILVPLPLASAKPVPIAVVSQFQVPILEAGWAFLDHVLPMD